jgi:hypothetical protein
MGERDNLDLGKIVGLIMENPQIVEQISALAKRDEEAAKQQQSPSETQQSPNAVETNMEIREQNPPSTGRYERAKLLTALKPYVSNERARAIDSMINIADIIDMMKLR